MPGLHYRNHATSCPTHPAKGNAKPLLSLNHISPTSLLIQRQPRLGTNLERPRHLIQQRLVLDRVPALERLYVLGRRVHLLGQLRLRHLVGPLFRAAVADVLADFGGHFVRRDDVVGAVDFGQTLAFGAGFAGLLFFWGCVSGMGSIVRVGSGGLTALPVANFFSVPTMAPLRWAWFRAPFPRTTVSRWEEPPPLLLPILVTVSQSSDMVIDEMSFACGGSLVVLGAKVGIVCLMVLVGKCR